MDSPRMRLRNRVFSWFLAVLMLLWRASVRVRTAGVDPRPALREGGRGLAIAFLHAHQVPGLFAYRGHQPMVMVSQSRDGDLAIPALRILGIRAARGSSRKRGQDKGGMVALDGLRECARDGGDAIIAIDGPQGPRNHVRRGIAVLALEEDVPIVPVVAVTSLRRILRSWDRLQLPWPLARVTLHWGTPIFPEGSSVTELRAATEAALLELERAHDPEEAQRVEEARQRRAQRASAT